MRIGEFDLSRKVLVIAEIGNNHEGSFSLAEDLVGKAAEAGAGAVKFQTFKTEHYISPRQKDRFERLKRFQLSYDDFEKLCRQARKAGLLFLSTPFDLESARFLATIADALKIASPDNTFHPLIEEVAKTGKPVILSSGLADLGEIRTAISLIRRTWRKREIEGNLAVLHCVTSYPVPPDQINLSAIGALRKALDGPIGFSDHSLGIEASVLAVALGARIIEKHFTIDNNFSDFRDHQLSVDPSALATLVERIDAAAVMLGDGVIGMAECEKAEAETVRRSICAATDLAEGTLLEGRHITWLRPGGNLPPGEESRILGRRLKCDLAAGAPLTPDTVE